MSVFLEAASFTSERKFEKYTEEPHRRNGKNCDPDVGTATTADTAVSEYSSERWRMCPILALRKPRQGDYEFKTKPNQTATISETKQQQKTKQKTHKAKPVL